MLILLPPSEGKTAPADGPPLRLDALSFPELSGTRSSVMDALVRLCREDPQGAAAVLGLGPTQLGEVEIDAGLAEAPTAPALDVYTGVLYDALGLATLDVAASRRADDSILVTSALWGLVRPADHIPAYRLGGGVSLPGVGPVARAWRPVLGAVVAEVADGAGVVVDLRSTTYDGFWRPAPELAAATAKLRVLHERDGKRSVVSHHSKATKGHVARALLGSGEEPQTPADLAELLIALGWKAELSAPVRTNRPWTLDVVVEHVPTR